MCVICLTCGAYTAHGNVDLNLNQDRNRFKSYCIALFIIQFGITVYSLEHAIYTPQNNKKQALPHNNFDSTHAKVNHT